MKRSINIILCIVCFGINSKAQHCSETINTQPGTTISIFDWTQANYDFVLGTPGNTILDTVQSPFIDGANNDNIYHLNNAAVIDFNTENGWELVMKRFGIPADPVSTPYLLLYNRYEGVLRVFAWIQQGVEAYNNAKLTLNFKDLEENQSAALSLMNSPMDAIDAWQRGKEMVTPNSYVNQIGGFWLFADYPVVYDPCTCNYKSTLEVRADLIDITSVSLTMEGGGSIEQILNTGNSTVSLPKLVEGALAQGSKVSKSIGGFISTGTKIYEKYQLKQFQESVPIFYDLLSDSEQAAVNEGILSNLTIPGWIKTLPKIGYVLGVAEYLIGGGKTTPPMPISFEANLKFDISGTNTDIDPHGAVDVYTPGSIEGSNNERKPSYNNTLGVFNILRTPEFEIAEVDNDFTICTGTNPPFCSNFRSILLNSISDIEYVVNPSSGLRVVDIKAAIVLDSENHIDYVSSPNPPFFPSTFLYYEADNGQQRWQSPFYPIHCLQDIVFNLGGFPSIVYQPSDFLDKVRLKLAVTLERGPDDPFFDPNADQVLIMIEYDTNVTEGQYNSISPSNTYDQILFSETVSDLSLTEDQTIYAWSNIEVGENIITNGHQLTLIAGKQITGNIADLPPNVDLIIGYPAVCNGDIQAPVSSQDLQTFCTSGDYNPIGQFSETPDERLLLERQQQKIFNIVASPNPFKEFINLQYTNSTLERRAKVRITDISGKQIDYYEIELQQGIDQRLSLPTKEWASGFYILTFETETYFESIKLVKQ